MSSKRQRKQRARGSLQGKKSAPRLDALDILAEAGEDGELLLQGLEDGDGSNALILGPKQGAKDAKDKRAQERREHAEQQQLSKAEARKLKQVLAKKERREGLTAVFSTLQQTALGEDRLQLLRPLHMRGARETKKQRLRRALKLQRAGVNTEAAAELLVEVKLRGKGRSGGGSSSGSDSEGGSSGSDDEDGGRAARFGSAAAAAVVPAAGGNSSSSEEEEEDGAPAAKRQKPAAAGSAGQAAGPAANGASMDTESEEEEKEEEVDEAALEAAAAAAEAAAAKKQRTMLSAARAEAAALRAASGTGGADPEEAAQAARSARERAAAAAAAAEAGGVPRRVAVRRPEEMQASREALPILGHESEIIEAVMVDDVIVLCGETGCGKTTQVPQFLLEAGYGCADFPERAGAIGVTQPRRVAAVSTAARVAAELGSDIGGRVGYQVRYDRRVGPDSAIQFLTDGVLLRQLQADFLLARYSVLLVDEAHERSLNTDLLLGMLSRVVPLRRRMHQEWVAGGRVGPPVYPLKLIIMSATLRTEDFTGNRRLFPTPPPVLTVPARQFPVTVHFSRRTEMGDYVGTAYRKVCRIHRELPPGGILVFLTGQREVDGMVRRLRAAFGPGGRKRRGGGGGGRRGSADAAAAADGESEGAAAAAAAEVDSDADDAPETGEPYGADAAEAEVAVRGGDDEEEEGEEEDAFGGGFDSAVDDFDQMEEDEDEEEVQVLGGDAFTPEEIAAAERRFEELYGLKLPGAGGSAGGGGDDGCAACGDGGAAAARGPGGGGSGGARAPPPPMHVLPLYAMLPQSAQAAAFAPPPAGHRLVVVATNVAETSITIPGIRYVVDAGRSKQKLLEAGGGGLVRYDVRWVSKASAAQRAGRAGRTGPGHTYRLYSSAHFNDTFPEHTPPEIVNTPLEGVVLVLKAMGVDKVAAFPFPTPPDADLLSAATRCLCALSALEPTATGGSQQRQQMLREVGGRLTALGTVMAGFPISPRHSRMVLEVVQWQRQQQQQQQQEADAEAPATQRGKAAKRARRERQRAAVQALPYAVALAAALSLDSPFMHVESVGEGEDKDGAGQQEGGKEGQAAAGSGEAEAEGKRKRNAASAAHARFRSEDGDALSVLRALCAYEAACAEGSGGGRGGALAAGERFCRDNFLHARHLKEMSALRRQLMRTLQQQQAHRRTSDAAASALQAQLADAVAAACGGDDADLVTAPLPLPPTEVEGALRRALAAGWCDQVARRVRSAQYVAKLAAESGRKRHAVRYQPCSLEEEVFLHPRSALHASAPEYVVYTQLVRTAKRPYMAGVTSVEAPWLAECGTPLAALSPPLTEPAPYYKPEADAVLSWHEVAYGQHAWPLPRAARPAADPAARAAAFAAALLSGRVLPAAAALGPWLVAAPATAGRRELAGLPRVGELLAALEARGVDSRAALAAAWRADPRYLRPQLALWVQKQRQQQLGALWPRLLAEAGLTP